MLRIHNLATTPAGDHHLWSATMKRWTCDHAAYMQSYDHHLGIVGDYERMVTMRPCSKFYDYQLLNGHVKTLHVFQFSTEFLGHISSVLLPILIMRVQLQAKLQVAC